MSFIELSVNKFLSETKCIKHFKKEKESKGKVYRRLLNG